MSEKELTFGIIGSGRVAGHLAPALVENGAKCLGVLSRTRANAETLATRLDAPAYDNVAELASQLDAMGADVLIISISDDAIAEVANQLPTDFHPMVVHTSGSTPMQVLAQLPSHGVLYPMQTFSPERGLDMTQVPFFIEANDEGGYLLLDGLARGAIGSQRATRLSSENRARLHLASVFACNFVNHMYASAEEVMHLAGLDFSLLQPLMEETLSKALHHSPSTVQTGPAVRGDQKTLQRHLALLESHPELQQLYTEVSDSITHKYSQTHE